MSRCRDAGFTVGSEPRPDWVAIFSSAEPSDPLMPTSQGLLSRVLGEVGLLSDQSLVCPQERGGRASTRWCVNFSKQSKDREIMISTRFSFWPASGLGTGGERAENRSPRLTKLRVGLHSSRASTRKKSNSFHQKKVKQLPPPEERSKRFRGTLLDTTFETTRNELLAELEQYHQMQCIADANMYLAEP